MLQSVFYGACEYGSLSKSVVFILASVFFLLFGGLSVQNRVLVLAFKMQRGRIHVRSAMSFVFDVMSQASRLHVQWSLAVECALFVSLLNV